MLKRFGIIDYVLVQDDEVSFRDLIRKIESGKNHQKITFCLREKSKVISPDKFTLGDMEDVPTPFFDKEILKYYRKLVNLVLPYEVSRGCVNNCFFCYSPLKGMGIRNKSLRKVVEDLSILSKKYKTKKFHFLDSEINFDRKYLLSFCKSLLENKLEIKWTALAIPKNLGKADIELMKEAGCVQLRFGAESGSERILARMDKNTNTKEMERILKDCKKTGIKSHLSFIVGLPEEKENDMVKTKEFVSRNHELIYSANVCPYNILKHIDLTFFSDIDNYVRNLVSKDSIKKLIKARELERYLKQFNIYSLDIIDVINQKY